MRAVSIARRGTWPEDAALDEVVLDHDRRHRRRLKFNANTGHEVLLDLPEAEQIRDGDALVLEEGGFIRVRAADEALLEIAAKDADALVRIAWHVGNRHLPAQFFAGRIRIEADHVIAAMLVGLGAEVTKVTAPFDPEPGAYHSHG